MNERTNFWILLHSLFTKNLLSDFSWYHSRRVEAGKTLYAEFSQEVFWLVVGFMADCLTRDLGL